MPTLNDAKIAQALRRGAGGDGRVARNDGDVDAAIKGAARVVRADYELPLLAHATLEPQNCTADVRADGVDLYVPTQVQQIAQATAAKAAGVDAREGEGAHHVSGRRLRSSARSGLHTRGRRGRPRPSKQPGEAHVDARRRHDARRVPSAGLRSGHRGLRCQGQAHRVETAPHRAVHHARACSRRWSRRWWTRLPSRRLPTTPTTCRTCASTSSSRRSASTSATGAR